MNGLNLIFKKLKLIKKGKATMVKTKYAVKIRYLGYDNKWHYHTTKWYYSSGDAWKEADQFENQVEWLEMSRSIAHK